MQLAHAVHADRELDGVGRRRTGMKMSKVLTMFACGVFLAACGTGGVEPAAQPSKTSPPSTTVPEPVSSVEITLPAATADAPGDAAVWVMDPAVSVERPASSFTALVTRLGCAGGGTGEVLDPVVEIGPDSVVVTFYVAVLDSDLEQTCQDNDAVSLVVDLGEPIGDRPLLDGACRNEAEAASTRHCAAGAARWVP